MVTASGKSYSLCCMDARVHKASHRSSGTLPTVPSAELHLRPNRGIHGSNGAAGGWLDLPVKSGHRLGLAGPWPRRQKGGRGGGGLLAGRGQGRGGGEESFWYASLQQHGTALYGVWSTLPGFGYGVPRCWPPPPTPTTGRRCAVGSTRGAVRAVGRAGTRRSLMAGFVSRARGPQE